MNKIFILLSLLFPINLMGQHDIQLIGKSLLEGELLYPSELVVVDEYLFVKDLLESTGEYGIKTYHLKDGEKVNEFITIGRGPSEFLNINIRKGPLDRTIEITDSRNRKNDIYSVDCLVHIETGKSIAKCLETSVPNMTSREAVIVDENLVLNTASSSNGVIYLSEKEKIVEHLDIIPEAILNKYKSLSIATITMGGYLVANRDRTKFAYFAKYYDQSTFFEKTEIGLEIIRENRFTHLPEFSVSNSGGSSYVEPSDQAKFGYKTPVASNNYIYVLYSGKTINDIEVSEDIEWRAYANRIKIFNWSGVEIGEFSVKDELSSIAVSSDDKVIYGITTDKDLNSRVIQYNLK